MQRFDDIPDTIQPPTHQYLRSNPHGSSSSHRVTPGVWFVWMKKKFVQSGCVESLLAAALLRVMRAAVPIPLLLMHLCRILLLLVDLS